MANLLDDNGLLYLWGKIKAIVPKNVSDLKNDNGYLTKHQDLSSYALKNSIPTKISDLDNDSGFLKEHQSLEGYAKTSAIPDKTSQLTNDSGFLKEHQSLEGYAKTSAIPDKTSQLTNDSGFLTKHQDLTGYATKNDLTTAIGNITGFDFSIVTELPATGKKGIIYLIAHAHGTGDAYDEYIWVGDKFEKIGNTDVDLSGYLKEDDITTITNAKIDEICV